MEFTLSNIIRVCEAMEIVLVGHSTTLLRPKYNKPHNPLFGHCIHASEAIVMIFDNEDLQLYRSVCEHADYHWWVQYHDFIIDPTSRQYTDVGLIPPYKTGILQTRTYGRDENWNDRYLSKSYFVVEKVLEYLNGSKLPI